ITAKIRARPADQSPNRQTAQRVPRMTPTAVNHLATAAEHMNDPGLAEVFRRLATRGRVRAPHPTGAEPSV
ncbi:MAG TPA: hypothetical protein VES73_14125, partial [Lamprocystis sp. (in: g-proteobacteria)]|nr:hypothetical protein [Lamprocystis sp. (in: g-proteobacteria)]